MKYKPHASHAHASMNEITVEVDVSHVTYLATLSTRQLLRFLEESTVTGYYGPYNSMKFTDYELKYVLDQREHVPNKIEARKIRQEKARR